MSRRREPPGRTSPKASGFTLIELLITLIVLGVLTAFALPSFSWYISTQRIKTASFQVMTSLLLARSEAIKRNTTVDITPTGGDWANGWTVNVGSTPACDATGTLLNKQEAFKNLSITTTTTCLTYNGSGRLTNTAAPSFTISGTTGDATARCISIDLSGRPNSKVGSC